MNTDQLEAFIYVVELKSIHKASKALYLSQPTVTARIKALERELNTDLFIRQGKQLILNQQGKEFVPYAQQILKIFREGKSNLKNKRRCNEVVFGANLITSNYFIPHALVLWKKEHPNVNFEFFTGTNEELIAKLINHEIDFAFTKQFSNENIKQQIALDNSIQLVVYPEHPYVQGENVTVKKLSKESIVFFECGAFDWNLIYKCFEIENVEPNIEFKVDQIEVAKSLIKNKQCIGFLPLLSIKGELENGELVVIKSPDFFTVKQHIYLSYIKTDTVEMLEKSIKHSIELFNNVKCLA